jgi:hypothetical protein
MMLIAAAIGTGNAVMLRQVVVGYDIGPLL